MHYLLQGSLFAAINKSSVIELIVKDQNIEWVLSLITESEEQKSIIFEILRVEWVREVYFLKGKYLNHPEDFYDLIAHAKIIYCLVQYVCGSIRAKQYMCLVLYKSVHGLEKTNEIILRNEMGIDEDYLWSGGIKNSLRIVLKSVIKKMDGRWKRTMSRRQQFVIDQK